MHYHIVGIGGFGMSAIARILLQRGHQVSGSDMRANAITAALTAEGATVYIGHAASHIQGCDILFRSTAIPDTNPEITAAYAQNIPVYDRRQGMGLITQDFRTIGVAGTHGKTTTTAMLGHVLTSAGRDPSIIVGGVMKSTGSNARVGKSAIFVIEADEYGGMFLGLSPEIAVINNIEHDHPDVFPSLEDLEASFRGFIERLQPHGVLIGGVDSPSVRSMLEAQQWQGLPTVSFSLTDDEAVWFAKDLQSNPDGTLTFEVHHENMAMGHVQLPMLGAHNVQNALAVCAVADYLGVPFAEIQAGLSTFVGTERRSEVLGVVNGVQVINDYAHHPTAVKTTIAAWKPIAQHLWVVWEPHTYNRMRSFVAEFATAFAGSDTVLVQDVYSVREEKTPGLDAPNLALRITEAGHPDARYINGGFAANAAFLAENVQNGDVVLIMSAGDAPLVGQLLIKQLQG